MAHFNLLAATTFLLLILLSAPSTTAVVDTDGNLVQPNTPYFITTTGLGVGGVTTLPKGSPNCPLYVALNQNFVLSQSLPVKFLPINGSDTVISDDSEVNIVFTKSDGVHDCPEPKGWSALTGGTLWDGYVTIGGVGGDPDHLSEWFDIRKSFYDDSLYEIRYCPGTRGLGDETKEIYCNNVGISFENGNGYLVFSRVVIPHLVRFVKAQS